MWVDVLRDLGRMIDYDIFNSFVNLLKIKFCE